MPRSADKAFSRPFSSCKQMEQESHSPAHDAPTGPERVHINLTPTVSTESSPKAQPREGTFPKKSSLKLAHASGESSTDDEYLSIGNDENPLHARPAAEAAETNVDSPHSSPDEASPRLSTFHAHKRQSTFKADHYHKRETCCQIALHDLSYSVKDKAGKKGEMKEVMHNVSCVFGDKAKGEMIAIMGQSGAGKTTLLNIIAQRVGGQLSGKITISGFPATTQLVKRLTGYVHQQDHLFPELTCFETLDFIARLTLKLTPAERAEKITALLDSIGLSKNIHQRVGMASSVAGDGARGLSGGERKRLCIAKALIGDPAALLLDEFTSGLDSETATSATEVLRMVASAGKTVICTIHQPSSDIFFQFDKLCLLAEGRIVYYGPTANVLEYFERLGPEFACPKFCNPAEHVMQVVYVSYPTDVNKSSSMNQAFTESAHGKELTLAIEASREDSDRLAASSTSPRGSAQYQHLLAGIEKPSQLLQLKELFMRAWRVNSRNKFITKIKMITSIIMGLLLGFIYFQMGDSQASISDRVFLIFYCSILQGVRLAMEAVRFFSEEKRIVLPEYENGYYDIWPYIFTKSIVDAPFMLVGVILFAIVLMPLANLEFASYHFFVFVAALFLVQLNAQSVGVFFASVLLDDKLITVVAPMIIMPTVLFSGVSAVHIPAALDWIAYVIYLKYGVAIMLRNDLEGRVFHCPDDMTCATPNLPGEAITKQYKLDFLSIKDCFGVLIAMAFAYRFLAFLFLRRAAKRKQA
eukprot:m.160859 g.160859  ORF g.160859 m.160859 type:complete len:754 (-) comp53029_c0_seq1:122-2383(-)